jgi:hypothetical protein
MFGSVEMRWLASGTQRREVTDVLRPVIEPVQFRRELNLVLPTRRLDVGDVEVGLEVPSG